MKILAEHLRVHGMRISAGPWTIYGESARPSEGKVIVALGRIAGKAATRSRIRRIAREVFSSRFGSAGDINLLLLARGDVTSHPRRKVRLHLSKLLVRIPGALARQ